MACVGITTTLLASLRALSESDLKRVVALSTLSQIGFLITRLGFSNIFIIIFHLISHALFKRCLFINVGFIIHQSYRAQDAREYNIR